MKHLTNSTLSVLAAIGLLSSGTARADPAAPQPESHSSHPSKGIPVTASAERLPPLDRETLNEYGKSVHDKILSAAPKLPYRIADENNRLIGMYRVLGYAPAMGEGINILGTRWNQSTHLSKRMLEISILATAAADKASFVRYAHEGLAKGLLTQGEIDDLRERKPLQLADPREQTVHDVTRALLEKGDLDDALYQRAVQALDYEGLVELIWVIGIYKIDALQLRVHRLGAPDDHLQPAGK